MALLTIPEQGGLSVQACAERARGTAPTLRRRLAAFLYEGVLLFGLVMVVALVYSIAVNQRHGLQGRQGMMVVLFLALAAYFVWQWSRGGQTLALRTWQLRLVTPQGGPLTPLRALARYLTSWLWFLPPMLLTWLAGWHDKGTISAAVFGWLALYACLTWVLPSRQFLHDVISGTRVIDNRKQVA
ncbi:MAG: RDD family protein [Aquabacterium sp.]|jgi:uncharacterized RDD family membrane protein YckC|uniref:RDD family protein n=1 Tax=Aquabacterium sp. TaxID=1872578 RepID=UPI002A36C44B|nr:RDD family protein [Aquabacterium sp.]MDX9843425.1 RDD family protein [Aquabacterium sp.]